jgi:hypothetical protein
MSGRTTPRPASGNGPGPRPSRARKICVGLLMLSALTVGGCGTANPSPSAVGTTSPPPSLGPGLSQTQTSAPPSQPPASGSTATIDACALMTAAEVKAIVGGPEPVAKALPGGGWVAGQCAWKSPVAGFLMSVGTATSIATFADAAAPDAAARLAVFKQRLTALGKAKDIPSLGDGAVLGPIGIAAYRDGTYLEILRLTLSDEQLIEVAKLTMSKL